MGLRFVAEQAADFLNQAEAGVPARRFAVR